MVLQTPQFQFELDETQDLKQSTAQRLGISKSQILCCDIYKKSLDVRHKHPRYQMVLRIDVPEDADLVAWLRTKNCVDPIPMPALPVFPRPDQNKRICIAGAGPSGLFAAMTLVAAGYKVDIFERGKPVDERARDIAALIHQSQLNINSNICFGEGGAGTYSDGKLMTRTKAREIPIILDWFIQFGAPECIRYEAHPHIGTDRLMPMMVQMRQYLESHGVHYYFNSKIEDFLINDGSCQGIVVQGEKLHYDDVFLCVGHSADDIFENLLSHHVALEPKPLAVGVRVEHPQSLINEIQYGKYAGHPLLPAAEYAVRFNHDKLPSVFSFCMCPGGRVVASQTTQDTRVVNGMSSSLRNGRYANSALVVQVGPELYDEGPLGGLHFIRRLERKAAENCPPVFAPAQNMMDFLHKRVSSQKIKTTYQPGTVSRDLHRILPPILCQSLREALPVFDRQMKGFVTSEANFIGIESRTSSPVRILRNDSYESVNIRHLYPLGEGAGYAGGITSCALDGVHAAITYMTSASY